MSTALRARKVRELLVEESATHSNVTYWRTGSTDNGQIPALKVITAYRPISRRYVAATGAVTLELLGDGRFTERAAGAPTKVASVSGPTRTGFDGTFFTAFIADETGRALATEQLR